MGCTPAQPPKCAMPHCSSCRGGTGVHACRYGSMSGLHAEHGIARQCQLMLGTLCYMHLRLDNRLADSFGWHVWLV